METLNTSLTRATVQDTANAAAQDIATNNPVPNLNASQPIRPVDDQTLWEAKKKREASTTTADYVSAAMHQDGFLNGFIANHVGNDMAVDSNYNILDPKTYEEATKGLPENLKPYMLDAHSKAHEIYLRSTLDDKINEQTKLGDLGWKGQTVRLVGGLASPENMLLMAGTMGIGGLVGGGSALARATRALQITTEMAEGPARVAAVAEATAALQKAAAEASTLKAGAAQIAGAAGINAGLEKLRQTYNFEDDTSGVIHAGLVGATLGAPFAFLHGREMARLRETAGNELALLNHIKAGDAAVAPEVLAQDTAMRKYMEDALVGEHIPAGAAAEGQRAPPRGALEGESVRVSDPAAIAQQRLLEGPKDILSLKEPETRTEREHPPVDEPVGPPPPPAALARARENNTFTGQTHAAAGRTEGFTQPKGTPVEKLFSNFADSKTNTPEQVAAFRDGMFKRANQDPKNFTNDHVETHDAPLGKHTVRVEAAKSGNTRVTVRDADGNVLASARVQKGKIDSIGVTEAAKGQNIGRDLLAYLDRERIANVDEVPDRSPGFVKIQKDVIGGRSAEPPIHEDDLLPEGMGFGSVGAAEAVPQAGGIAPTYLRNGRLDFYATLNRNPNTVVQELAHILIKDPLGNSKTEAQGWAASELKRNIQRTVGGEFHREALTAMQDAARKMAVPMMDRARFADDFYRAVSKVTRGDPDVATTHAAIMPELQRASAQQQKVYEKILERAKAAGVKGAQGVDVNAAYVNRVFNFDRINELIRAHGEAPIHTMLANAMPWLAGKNLADRTHGAKMYLSSIRKLEFSHMATDVQLHAHDMVALRSELTRAGLSDSEVNAIVDSMFDHTASPTAGNPGTFKYRFKLDENAPGLMPDGTQIKVSDLFENDSRVLVDKYLNSMAGHTALAEKGIRSRAEFMQWMKAAEDEHLAQGHDVGRFEKDKQHLQDLYDHVTGRPMSTQSFNTTDRIANATRALTRSAVLGQLGIAAAFEMHKAIVMGGLRAMLQQMPTFRATINAVRKGAQFTDKLGRDIQTLWGFGTESAAGHAREHEISEFAYDKGLTRYENFANKASHVIDHVSGNAFLTSATREMASRFTIQKFANWAAGKKMSAKQRERLVMNGVDDSAINSMLRDMHQYVDRQGDRVVGIRYEQWQRDHPISFDNFQRGVDREVRDAIQEHDIGETMPWMHTTLGKVFAELRTFMLVGHAKNTLKALHYHDATSLNQLMYGIVSEALSYSLQTSLNFAGNPQELQRRLRSDNMAKAIFQRMSISGVLPSLLQTPLAMTGHSVETSTVNTDNRNLALTPSMQFALRVAKLPVVAGQSLLAPNTVTTQQEMRDAFGAFPGGNTWVVRNLADWMAQGHPKAELPQQR